jgi:hypothetical protein
MAQVPQLPRTFCGNEGVLECSGLTELWMGIERVDGKIQSGVKPPQSKKPVRSRGQSHNSNVLTGGEKGLTRRREKVGDGPSAAVTQDFLWP